MSEYHFDQTAADDAVYFFQRHLKHVIGKGFAGKAFTLLPWQEKITRDMFGWKRSDGTRRYRTVYVEIPRKNGKSFWSAGLALYLLLCDKEPQAQVYSAAGDRGQARVVFEMARDMIAANPFLGTLTEIYQHRILGTKLNSFYTALSSEAYTKHGMNPSGIIFDELHVQPNRELWDVLATGVGAREQPLTIAITTAGHNRASLCWEMHNRALATIAEPESDPYFYPVIYAAQPEDDWTDPAVWAKANPSLGHALKIGYLEEKCAEAKNNPAVENTFKNLNLNIWTEQAIRAIPMAHWDQCPKQIDLESLRGKSCYAGLDLASTRDIAALVLVFNDEEDGFIWLPYFWMPEEAIDLRAKQDTVKAKYWAERGFISMTPGNETDYGEIRRTFSRVCDLYDVRNLSYDPWNAAALVQLIQEDCYPADRILKFGQSFANFNEPLGKLVASVVGHKLNHGDNPVLRWMAGNFVAKKDSSGNMRPDKGSSSEKIDGIVAGLMGMAFAMRTMGGESAYDDPNYGM